MTEFDIDEQRLRRTLRAVAERSPVAPDYEQRWARRTPPTSHRPRQILVGVAAAVVLVGAVAAALAYGPRSSNGGGPAPVNSAAKVSWTPERPVAPNFGLGEVACTSASFCLGLGADSQTGAAGTTVWNGTRWTTPRTLGAPRNGLVHYLSCASPTFCEALSTGVAYRWNGARWSSGAVLAGAFASSDPTDVTSVSCPSSSFCMAIDTAGDDFTFDGQTWSAPAHFDSTESGPNDPGTASSVSCSSATSCMVTDSDGYALRWNGTSWLTPVDITPPALGTVSCPTARWCLAINQNSYVSIWNGDGWSGPRFVDPESMHISQRAGSSTPVSWGQGDFGLLSASCASPTFCVAIDDAGYAVSFDGTSWSSPQSFGPGLNNEDTVACAGPRFCVINSDDGQVVMSRK